MPNVTIRRQRDDETVQVRALNDLAFGGRAEALLVAALLATARPVVSLVAEADDGAIVGHILFSPMSLDGAPERKVMGLAPLSVAPDRQGEGIGGALIRAGIEACRELGAEAVMLLGHTGYYPRFGFAPASRFGLHSIYDGVGDAFMALELAPGALTNVSGLARYHPAFNSMQG